MKKENGITLMSLIIYMILLLMVITMLATVSNMFIKNKDIIEDTSKYSSEINKFNMYFIDDVKNNKSIYSISSNQITFIDGTTYVYLNNAIYRDKVKICDNITSCIFTQRTDNSTSTEKTIVNVQVRIGGIEVFNTSNDYVLKYW